MQPAPPPPPYRDLLAHYAARTAGAGYDEALAPDGAVRPHWRPVLDWAARAGPSGYEAVTAETRRLRLESGVAFDPAGEPASASEDLFPLILDPADWDALAAGVAQRARLLEATLTDLEGPRTLLREGVLPPGLVHGNPDFALSLLTPRAPEGRPRLHLYEADLARGADGRWRILADRADAPLGDGWLIANRAASAQSLAEPFLAAGVRRLAGHYAAFQAGLEDAAGPDGRVALLSGGARDARHFSHAFFARYLGAALVEPADLTVRDGGAYVKTVDGLKPLAVLLRGVHDRRVDALFRPAEAAPGAPALSLAARSGRVTIANALGAAAVGWRAAAPYAHLACARLLGEDLALDDAPLLWLGDPEARAQALAEPERWRIEHLTRGPAPGLPRLSDPDRAALARRLRREGDGLVAVAAPDLATTPTWRAGALAPRQYVLRVFAALTPEGWSVAPGGVAATVDPGRPIPPLGFGKDVWIPAREGDDTPPPSLARRFAGAHLRRTGGDLLSRVADDLFWLGRGAERAEATLRTLHLAIDRLLGGREQDGGADVIAAILEVQAGADESRQGLPRVRDAIARLTADPHENLGLPALLSALRRAAQRARPYLSEEGWRALDRLLADPGWRNPPTGASPAALLRLIEDSLLALAAFSGAAAENQTRNHVWRFLELGRAIERGLSLARAAERLAGRRAEPDEPRLRAWLAFADSRTAYRTRYQTTPAPIAAIDLLILDEANPRSLVHQLLRLEAALERLPSSAPRRSPERRRVLRALLELQLADPEALAEEDAAGARPALLALLATTRESLAEVSDRLAAAYFSHAEAASPLSARTRAPR